MRQANLKPRRTWRCPQTTDSRHALPIAPNRLNRQFAVAAPNRVWGSDITALWTLEGWLYIAIVVDLFSRKVVGWACAASMATCFVTSALQMAIGQRQPKPGLLHHSDRGSQYTSDAYQKRLNDADFIMSMSRSGSCLDNAPMESFWATLKRECADGPFASHAQARSAIFSYVMGFYNQQRKHSALCIGQQEHTPQ